MRALTWVMGISHKTGIFLCSRVSWASHLQPSSSIE